MSQKIEPREDLLALLVAACSRNTSAESLAGVTLLNNRGAYDAFSELALEHGVRGLAFDTLLQRGAITSPVVREALTGTLRAARRRAMLMQLERDHVAATLATKGLPTIILKGAGLASTAFSAPVQRDFGDIDILVRKEDVSAATDALLTQGYVAEDAATAGYLEHHFHVRVQRPSGTIVEVHWAVTNPEEPYTLDPAAVMRESVTHPEVSSARVPRAEHVLLHMVVENVRDAFTRLTRVVDIDRIVSASPEMDWEYLLESARQAHLWSGLWLALQTSVAMFGTAVPETVLHRIAPPLTVRSHVALLKVSRSLLTRRALRRPSWGLLLQLWLVNDRSRGAALARLYRGDDLEELEWLWAGEAQPVDHRPGTVERLKRVGKVMAYQVGTYATVFTR